MTTLRLSLRRTWVAGGLRGRAGGAVVLTVGLSALALSVLLATAVGTASIALGDSARIIVDALPLVQLDQTWSDAEATILLEIRLPRVIAAALVGAALSVAGTLFQGLFRNPMADPFILGVSSGAALAAVVGFVVFPQVGFFVFGFSWVPFLAFVGALLAVALVYAVARTGGQTSITTLLLAGIAIGAFLTAVQAFLMFTQSDAQFRLAAVFSWLMGGVGTVGWGQFALLAPFVGVGLVVARVLAIPLNALALGDEQAGVLGVPVEATKAALVAAAALMTAAAVAAAGLIGFVGLVVPHVMRLVVGPDHRRLLWSAALYGAVFMVLADLVARTALSPQEIPVGIITGIVGGPFFLFLLRRAQGRYGF